MGLLWQPERAGGMEGDDYGRTTGGTRGGTHELFQIHLRRSEVGAAPYAKGVQTMINIISPDDYSEFIIHHGVSV